jgi:PLP dependent protein
MLINDFLLKNFPLEWIMKLDIIEKRASSIMNSVPNGVIVIAAAKTRNIEEVRAALRGGVEILGYNYVQEAVAMQRLIGHEVKWHMIGHLQRNKVKIAVNLFDMIETIDSIEIAREINKRCELENKVMEGLIETNSGEESNKTGILPKDLEEVLEKIKDFSHLHILGLMTMGPRFGNPENARPYFRLVKNEFDKFKKANIPNIEMKYLSMGMSNTYKIAIEEGANIIRIGNNLFEN